ncbi:hypothetical protein EYF80_011787 [Liparis tanakae]|uniref:Uncharacterized protein n=1 Tax=Liparis tanakae TaxID=230148 RepID=A0A4Z2ILI4_9TELE|nr:hypothetical protein EYF80_011787 [Liparis tanakae]
MSAHASKSPSYLNKKKKKLYAFGFLPLALRGGYSPAAAGTRRNCRKLPLWDDEFESAAGTLHYIGCGARPEVYLLRTCGRMHSNYNSRTSL